jgi:hypothetical protein
VVNGKSPCDHGQYRGCLRCAADIIAAAFAERERGLREAYQPLAADLAPGCGPVEVLAALHKLMSDLTTARRERDDYMAQANEQNERNRERADAAEADLAEERDRRAETVAMCASMKAELDHTQADARQLGYRDGWNENAQAMRVSQPCGHSAGSQCEGREGSIYCEACVAREQGEEEHRLKADLDAARRERDEAMEEMLALSSLVTDAEMAQRQAEAQRDDYEALLARLQGEFCLLKVADDEPIFVLRAQDKLAPTLVRHWANLSMRAGEGLGPSALKVVEALGLADAMEVWQRRTGRAKWPAAQEE